MNTLRRTTSRQLGGSSYHCGVLQAPSVSPAGKWAPALPEVSESFFWYHPVTSISFLEVMLTPLWHNAVMGDSPEHPRPFPAALVQAQPEDASFDSRKHLLQMSGWLPGGVPVSPWHDLSQSQYICSMFDVSHPQHTAEKPPCTTEAVFGES